jgi:alkylresorcinol/alkylpyrone synthase
MIRSERVFNIRECHVFRTRTMRHAEIPMFLNGLGTANPPQRYTKTQCWEAFGASEWFLRLDRRSRAIAETVLLHDNGIEARRLALTSLDEAFLIDPDTLHRRFASHAPALAAEAGAKALADAALAPIDVDAVVVSTCTGYLCPGLSSYVVERLGLPRDIQAFDLVGQGCAAALPNWRLAKALLGAGDAQHVLSICVEVSSAAMYLDNDPGVLISACLFGDGAGAAVLSSESRPGRRSVEFTTACSLVNPDERDALRFESSGGMLRNVLTRPVPRLAADHARQVLDAALSEAGLAQTDITAWILHAGGRDVLKALQGRLDVEAHELGYSAAMLHEYGNMSSAFVYFVLQAALAASAPRGWWWVSSFGAGFSCHGALLRVA